ncbi:MAG: DUF2256 domain-containing protein [Pseudomonadota bacterium]
MAHKKANLPQKICPVCDRPFTWRKKWERDWETVLYCSKRCAKQKARRTGQTQPPSDEASRGGGR